MEDIALDQAFMVLEDAGTQNLMQLVSAQRDSQLGGLNYNYTRDLTF